MKKLLIIAVCLLKALGGMAQVEVGLDFTSELQTDFTRLRETNLVEVGVDAELGRGVSVSVHGLSVASSDKTPVVDSNIDADDCPMALSVAGVAYQRGGHMLFGGLRRMDEDYFCSSVLGLFTGSAYGGFPTLSENAELPAFPSAGWGVHYGYEGEHLSCQVSLYGCGGLAEMKYARGRGECHIGGALWRGGGALWAYGEQGVARGLWLVGGYSQAFGGDVACRHYALLGGRYEWGPVELGMVADFARRGECHEWSGEVTCRVPLGKYVALQPAVRVAGTQVMGLLRCSVCL